MKTKVYIVNKSFHDFTPAKQYGELVFLSEGPMGRYEINHMLRLFSKLMADSDESDKIVLSGLTVMNIAACVVFALKHNKLNLLLFKNGRYIEQNLNLSSLRRSNHAKRHNRRVTESN